MSPAIRVRTNNGWQDIAYAPAGPPGLKGIQGIQGAQGVQGAKGTRTLAFATSGYVQGPWGKRVLDITLPWVANLLLSMQVTCFAQYVGVNGMQWGLMGVTWLPYPLYFFNETYSHKQCIGHACVLNVPAGTWGIDFYTYGSTISNDGDYGSLHVLAVEV